MNYTAYQITRHVFCMAVAFVPRRVATALLDAAVDRWLPDLDAPIIVETDDGRTITL